MEDERTRIQLNIQREYVEFLDDTNEKSVYNDRIKDMIKGKRVRLTININDLRKKFPDRCHQLLVNGFEELPLIMKALREVVATIDSDFAKDHDEFFVGFEGSFGAKHVTPRTLSSRFLGNMVCVEGIITKCSIIRPKVVRSVHYCPATKKTMERRYNDITSFDVVPSVNMYPTKDDDGNLLETEYGLSKYRDHQTVTIQEMPEKAPTGQLPRSLDIVLDNDLVDQCKPGDRILVVGVYRCLPGKQGGYTNGVFKTILLANQITMLSKDANLAISVDDVKECKKFSKTANPFETLARSLAPTIHGHEFIKKAVLCLLLGGVEKVLPNGTRLRGDINVLLIGDPSVAKSQMLRYVANVAPRVIMTTGRGSSGVGLTAAVTTDMETGDRRLEAGAMVLADRGIVCIDEFDKMSDVDRTAIHEVMEQGRVTISKAGIHARLNARTAVLAAANPVYGRYDEYKSPMDNIGLQDSLLSRFDLLFIVLDTAEPEHDRAISEHVLRIHRYRNPAEQDGDATPLFQNDQTLSTYDPEAEKRGAGEGKTTVYEKHNELLHGLGGRGRGKKDKILSMDFMKKYIHIAKCIKPALSPEASKVIAEEYARLRSLNTEDNHVARTQPITARSLETMIRLSTAHARARMSKLVTKEDALAAIDLVQFAYFKKILEKEKKKRRQRDEDEDEMNVEDTDAASPSENGTQNGERESRSKRARKDPPENSEDPSDTELLSAEEASLLTDSTKQKSVTSTETEEMEVDGGEDTISDERYESFQKRLATLFTNERETSLSLDKVHEWMSQPPSMYSASEINGGLQRMENEDKLMQAAGMVFLLS